MLLIVIGTLGVDAVTGQDELKRLTTRLQTPPSLKPEAGFMAKTRRAAGCCRSIEKAR